jgi:hypothetical protein
MRFLVYFLSLIVVLTVQRIYSHACRPVAALRHGPARVLPAAQALFRDNDKTFFMNRGALLGLVRDGRLVFWDTDLDLYTDADTMQWLSTELSDAALAEYGLARFGPPAYPDGSCDPKSCKLVRLGTDNLGGTPAGYLHMVMSDVGTPKLVPCDFIVGGTKFVDLRCPAPAHLPDMLAHYSRLPRPGAKFGLDVERGGAYHTSVKSMSPTQRAFYFAAKTRYAENEGGFPTLEERARDAVAHPWSDSTMVQVEGIESATGLRVDGDQWGAFCESLGLPMTGKAYSTARFDAIMAGNLEAYRSSVPGRWFIEAG